MNKVRCPICENGMDGQGPKEWPHWPFCSKRCKLIDLGRWLSGSYRLQAPVEEEVEDSEGEESSRSPNSAVPSAVPNREEA